MGRLTRVSWEPSAHLQLPKQRSLLELVQPIRSTQCDVDCGCKVKSRSKNTFTRERWIASKRSPVRREWLQACTKASWRTFSEALVVLSYLCSTTAPRTPLEFEW